MLHAEGTAFEQMPNKCVKRFKANRKAALKAIMSEGVCP